MSTTRLTIHDIKRECNDTHFFNRGSLKFFGQTMKSFSVRKIDATHYRISAPMYAGNRYCGQTVRIFNTETKQLEREKCSR